MDVKGKVLTDENGKVIGYEEVAKYENEEEYVKFLKLISDSESNYSSKAICFSSDSFPKNK